MVTRHRVWPRFTALLLGVGLVGCEGLEVSNPNAPERERAFSDPATIINSAVGTIRSYINTRWDLDMSGTMTTMSDSFTWSWNNFNSRYYASAGQECPDRCAWVNSTSSGLGFQAEVYWYRMYSMLSSANDALFAIRVSASPPDLGPDLGMTETIAQLTQAWGYAWLALIYDQAFIALEDSDVLALEFADRVEVRDKAIELFEKAVSLASSNDFETPDGMFSPGGPTYTNEQIAKVAYTAAAELLAHFPRHADENAQVNWAKVAEYASKGISSDVGAPAFDFEGFRDQNRYLSPELYLWGNWYDTGRVDTRVARLLSTSQEDPWPAAAGVNPQPVDGAGNPIGGIYGVDLRMGDGTFGDVDNFFGVGELKATANAGTDFVWSPQAIFIPGRGSEHQSNIGRTREWCLVGFFPPPCSSGIDDFFIYGRTFNDLLWAEGLIRTNQDLAKAAELINNTRVVRGGLPAVNAGDGQTELLRALAYEQDVELMIYAGTQFFNRRRVSKLSYSGPIITSSGELRLMDPEGPHVLNTLWKDSPRHVPVPARDLNLLRLEIYTFGGVNNPGGVSAPIDGIAGVRSVREIAAEMERASTERTLRRRH